MPRTPHKIKDSIEDLSKINNNFDNIALDIADRSGAFSSTATISGVVVSAGGYHLIEISVIDVQNRYEQNRCPMIPRLLTYVDTDNDGSYIWPLGGSLSAAAVFGIDITIFASKIVLNEVDNEKATIIIKIKNDDSVSHTFYLYADGYYVPAPLTGVTSRN